jgi:glycosyltransferase involved in cell wall biosynthesis
VLLRALAQLTGERAEAAVVFVGAGGRREELAARADDLGVARQVSFADAGTRSERYAYLAALDAVVSLPHPAAGDTSGMVERAMSAGTCLVVGDCANLAELPAEACIHVPVHDDPAPGLARALRRLVERPSLRRALGGRAVRHAALELHPRRCARRYVEVVAAARYLAGGGPPMEPAALAGA